MRYRPSAGRLIVELFYGSEHLERKSGVITLDVSKMARKLHVRPVRLVETLEWMQSYGIILDLSFSRKKARLVLKEPQWKTRKVFNG